MDIFYYLHICIWIHKHINVRPNTWHAHSPVYSGLDPQVHRITFLLLLLLLLRVINISYNLYTFIKVQQQIYGDGEWETVFSTFLRPS